MKADETVDVLCILPSPPFLQYFFWGGALVGVNSPCRTRACVGEPTASSWKPNRTGTSVDPTFRKRKWALRATRKEPEGARSWMRRAFPARTRVPGLITSRQRLEQHSKTARHCAGVLAILYL